MISRALARVFSTKSMRGDALEAGRQREKLRLDELGYGIDEVLIWHRRSSQPLQRGRDYSSKNAL